MNQQVKDAVRLINAAVLAGTVLVCGISCNTNKYYLNVTEFVTLPKVTYYYGIQIKEKTTFSLTMRNRTNDTLYYDKRLFHSVICFGEKTDENEFYCKEFGLSIINTDPVLVECQFEQLPPRSSKIFVYSVDNVTHDSYSIESYLHFFNSNPSHSLCDSVNQFNSYNLLKAFRFEFVHKGKLYQRKKVNAYNKGILIPPKDWLHRKAASPSPP